MDLEVVELKVTVATLIVKVESLSKTVEDQNKSIQSLLELANKGKGSLWLLMSLGGIIGFLLTKLGAVAHIFFG